MTIFNITSLKKALQSLAVAFFAFNTLWAQQPISLSALNSSADELHPVIHPSGDLYFTRALYTENNGGTGVSGDIWKSSPVSAQEFSPPVKVNDLSTDSKDLVIGFPNERTAYVFHNQYQGMHGIFVYQKSGESWQMDSALNIPGFRSLGPHFDGRLSQNGEILLFSMQSFGSYGNEDLYVSRKKKDSNSWSRPFNLGPTINSSYQELTPYFREEGNILFFSSNRPGEGSGYQLFYSFQLDDSFTQWSPPIPLTFLDKEGVTLSFMENPSNGNTYITSTSSSEGYGDIFLLPAEIRDKIDNMVTIGPKEKIDLIPKTAETVTPEPAALPNPVLEKKPSVPKDAEINQPTTQEKRQGWIAQLTAQINDFSLKGISPSGEMLSADDTTALDAVDGSWILSVPGYIPLTVDWDQPFSMGNLTPAAPGSRLDLSIIQFERSSYQLADSLSLGYIQTLAEFLIRNPSIKIGLEGHTDNLGNVELNKTLSTLRASQIRDLLVKQGVDFERIRISGFGGTRPIADNKTEAGRILNRRVELVVLEN